MFRKYKMGQNPNPPSCKKPTPPPNPPAVPKKLEVIVRFLTAPKRSKY